MKQTHKIAKTIISLLLVVALFVTQFTLFLVPVSAASSWSQTNWSGGSGQTSWSDTTKFDSSSSVTTSTANQATLTNTEKLSNTGFETDLTGWSTTSTFKDSDFVGVSGAVAAWPLDDTTTTQSYSRVVNPAVATGRNIVIDGGFDDATKWTLASGATVASSVLHFDGTSVTNTGAVQAIPMVVGKAYQITYTVSNYVQGSSRVFAGSGTAGTTRTANGTYTETLIASGTMNLYIYSVTSSGNPLLADIDNVSVKQLNIPDSSATPTQILVDGNMETAVTGAWTAGGSATLSKQTGTPHGGTQVLRIARSTVDNPRASQANLLTVGQVYRIYGYARSDGTAIPRIARATAAPMWDGTTSTAWQPFDFVFVAADTSDGLFTATTSTGTTYVEFDDVVVSLDTGIRQGEMVQDGDMAFVDSPSSWTSADVNHSWKANNATLSKETLTQHGGSSGQVLRVLRTGATASAFQNVMRIGKTYRVAGWYKTDGVSSPQVTDFITTYFTGTTATSWTYFETTFIAQNVAMGVIVVNGVNGVNFIDFDDVSVTELDPLVGKPTNGVVLGSTASGHLTNAYTFDGTNDSINIYSSDLNSAFNSNEGTLVTWAKVSGSGIWTDNTLHVITRLDANDNNNFIAIDKNSTNKLLFRYAAGGTTKSITESSALAPTDWFQVVMSWSKSTDQVKAYINGVQIGSTQTGLGTWAANLYTTTTVVGAASTSGTFPWSGMVNDVRLYNRALTASEITTLYTGVTTTRDTATTYNATTGSAKVVAPADQTAVFTQSVNVGDTNSYNLSAYAYTSGAAITSSDAALSVNGSAISTTYTSVGGGWYQLTGTFTGVASAINYGVQVAAGKTVYLDNISVNNYASSGTLTSSIFDTGQGENWGVLTLSTATPTNTTATVKVRTSNSATMSGATDFASCSTISSGVDISSATCVTDMQRYVQYQVAFTSSNLLSSPTFSSFSLAYTGSDTLSPVNLDLVSPSDNSYTGSERPVFTWKAATDAEAGVAKYQFIVKNDDKFVFTLDDISPSRSSDYVTNKYVVHYENFTDSDQTNDLISLYTKDSSDWAVSDNNGKLKEGKNVWTVLAIDAVGNSQQVSHNVYFDTSAPTVTLLKLGSVSFDATQKNWYYTTLKPTFVGASSEAGTVIITLDKLGFNTLVPGEYRNFSVTTVLTETSGAFSWTPQNLEYGDYHVSIKSKDGMGNTSSDLTFNLNITNGSQTIAVPAPTKSPTPAPGPVPSKNTPTPSPTNVPDRAKPVEGGPVSVASPSIFALVGNGIGQAVTRFLSGVASGVRGGALFVSKTLLAGAGIVGRTIGFGVNAVANLNREILTFIGHGFTTLASGVSTVYNTIAQKTPGMIRSVLVAIASGVENVTKTVAAIAKSVTETANNIAAGVEYQVGQVAFAISAKTEEIGYRLIPGQLAISDVVVEPLSATSVKISWKTNYLANGKVNYGLDNTYPLDVQSQDKTKNHSFVLVNLTPDTEYSFEVMSQNKNYVYDANRKFKTPKE